MPQWAHLERFDVAAARCRAGTDAERGDRHGPDCAVLACWQVLLIVEACSSGEHAFYSGLKRGVSFAGGTAVGALATSDTIPPLPSAITGQPASPNSPIYPRGRDLNVTWIPGGFAQPNGVATLGGESISANNVSGQFQCTVPVAPGQFAAAMPDGSERAVCWALWLGQYDTPTAFTAPGLDKGIISSGTFLTTLAGFE